MKMCIDRPVDQFQAMQVAQQVNPQNAPDLENLSSVKTTQMLQQRVATMDMQQLPSLPADVSQDMMAIAMPETFKQIQGRILDQMDPIARMQVTSKNQRGSLVMVYMALMTQKQWPNGHVLRVTFLDENLPVQRRIIALARQWEAYANIHFDFLPNNHQSADLRIGLEFNGRSWSYLGTDALLIPTTEPTMNFGWLTATSSDDAYARVVLHEFGHALGAIHEHQHPDAGIPWDKEAVYAAYEQPPNNWSREQVDINLFHKYSHNQLNYSTFDPTSIMLYAIDNKLTLGNWEVGWNSQLSALDKEFIATMYPKNGSTPESAVNGVTELILGIPHQSAIDAPGKVKIFRFNANVEGAYIFETTGITDLSMALHKAENGADALATDDDSGEAWNPRIMINLTPGVYEARVQHCRDDATGSFGIVVK